MTVVCDVTFAHHLLMSRLLITQTGDGSPLSQHCLSLWLGGCGARVRVLHAFTHCYYDCRNDVSVVVVWEPSESEHAEKTHESNKTTTKQGQLFAILYRIHTARQHTLGFPSPQKFIYLHKPTIWHIFLMSTSLNNNIIVKLIMLICRYKVLWIWKCMGMMLKVHVYSPGEHAPDPLGGHVPP